MTGALASDGSVTTTVTDSVTDAATKPQVMTGVTRVFDNLCMTDDRLSEILFPRARAYTQARSTKTSGTPRSVTTVTGTIR